MPISVRWDPLARTAAVPSFAAAGSASRRKTGCAQAPMLVEVQKLGRFDQKCVLNQDCMVKKGNPRASQSGPAPRSPRKAHPARHRRAEAERHSLAAVLNLIRGRGAMTRQAIESFSGLRRAVVAERLVK